MPLQEIEIIEAAEALGPYHGTTGQREVADRIPEMGLARVLLEVPVYERIEVRPTVPSPAEAAALEDLAVREVQEAQGFVAAVAEVPVSVVAAGVLPEVPVLEVLGAVAQEALVALEVLADLAAGPLEPEVPVEEDR